MRGKFAKKQGKVERVDVKNAKVQITGLQMTKKGGEKLETWFQPSNVKIVSLDTSDKKRFKRSKVKSDEKARKELELNKEEVASKE